MSEDKEEINVAKEISTAWANYRTIAEQLRQVQDTLRDVIELANSESHRLWKLGHGSDKDATQKE